MNYFENKLCVITGASSGIGLELGKQLLERGAKVVFGAHGEKGVENVRRELDPDPARSRIVAVDVRDYDSVKHMIDVAGELGEIDILFNNAGISRAMLYEQTTPEIWKEIMDINVTGVVNGIHAVLPQMLKRGGQIVNTSSISGLVPTPFQSMYSASKFAVVGLSESLRYELERYGIAVSVICPSDVRTPMGDKTIYFNGQLVKNAFAALEAVEVDDAVRIMLDGVEKKQGVIIVGRTGYHFYDMYHGENGDEKMRAWTANRIAGIQQLFAAMGMKG